MAPTRRRASGTVGVHGYLGVEYAVLGPAGSTEAAING